MFLTNTFEKENKEENKQQPSPVSHKNAGIRKNRLISGVGRFLSVTGTVRAAALFLACNGLLCLGGCDTSENSFSAPQLPEISFAPLAKVHTSDDVLFSPVSSAESGINFTNELRPENVRNYVLNGAGLATGDYDNDGLVDLFLISQDGANRLYRQTHPWKFDDVTENSGDLTGGQLWATGASFADVNRDGWLDLYVCNLNGKNELHINQQDGTFKNEAKLWGVDWNGASTMASFADFDGDGDLDLYLLNNRIFSIGEESPKLKLRMVGDKKVVHPDYQDQYFILEGRLQEAGQRDRLFRNEGNRFVDASDELGIDGYDMGLSATWWDYNNDGLLDIYVANDLKSPDRLYQNMGDRFKDVLPAAVGHTPWFSMGADAGDLNNDGRLDLLVADMSSTTHYKQKTTMGEMGNSAWFLELGPPQQFMRNCCYLGTGTERLLEVANIAGLDSTDWSWSIKFADFDCDGLLDVFVTNGVGRNVNDSDLLVKRGELLAAGKKQEADRFILEITPLEEENLVFRNRGNLTFENKSQQWGANFLGLSNGASTVDIDRDGDLDLVVNNLNSELGLYRNDCSTGERLVVKLVGNRSDTCGVGARVTIETETGTQVRQLKLASGFMSADEPLLHFGLGDETTIRKLTVAWPSGIVQSFEDIESGQLVTIAETGQSAPVSATPEQFSPLFKSVESGKSIGFQHREKKFDDFEHQPLLPNRLSQLGPGLAWADVDNNGLDDCFVGGAAGEAGRLFMQKSVGEFVPTSGFLIEDRLCEDMGALFIDFDGDGDEDLYVVSGGVESPHGDPNLQDRLYENDGKGSFKKTAGCLPDFPESGSSVAAADFDRDGDVDIFVATRTRRGQWPLACTSQLMINQDGVFVLPDESTNVFKDVGLVTGAVWSDVNGDNWVDLLLGLEWGPIKVFQNNRGTLVETTRESGLEDLKGWWNGIAAGDVDNDGDIDFVATNVGLNTKYHATREHPVQLFANDFDDNGILDVVEAEWEGEKCFPVRGRSCSSRAIPFIAEKFGTFHDFALAELTDIYSESALQESQKFEANTLESILMLNDGSGKFTVSKLPWLAQISPGFGISICDFDIDGNADIFIAQNFVNAQPETGRQDGGQGALLRGDGKGGFKGLWPGESGIAIPQQSAAATVVDFNRDNVPDLAVATNNGPVHCFVQSGKESNATPISIRLSATNSTTAGAKVIAKFNSGRSSVRELYAGSGYLSQSSPTLFFTQPEGELLEQVEVTWPDGSRQTEDLSRRDPAQRITIEKRYPYHP